MSVASKAKDPFSRFLQRCRPAMLRISRHTRGELSLEEVQAEAWLMVDAFEQQGKTIDLDHLADEQRIIAHLYQQLVRYTELNVRHAVRLDHSPGGDEGESHPLMGLLAAAPHYDPIVSLMAAEDDVIVDPPAHQSLAAAYVELLRRFDNRMPDVADHLLISISYCYRRCAHARRLAVQQQPLPVPAVNDHETFMPRAWRRFRVTRVPLQLSFDFDLDVGLFESEAPMG